MTLMNNYGTRTTTLVRGEGAYVWDNTGKRYLDALSGIAVCGLGYGHPGVTQAISEQAKTLLHTSNLYLVEPQVQLAKKLKEVSGMDTAFFCNSGAEANEAAIKIARKWGSERGRQNPHIITCDNSFHGRTLATLTATGNPKVKTGFSPLIEGFSHVAYNNIQAIKDAACADTVAVMVEPIQGEGGIRIPSDNYLTALRELCNQNNWLLILDEIQTGNGRTGSYFHYQQHNIQPDVVTTAKGLGNGVPIGACLAAGEAATVLGAGSHGSTFGGNPMACNAALAVIDALYSHHLMERAGELGARMGQQFRDNFASNTRVVEVRQCGLMIGIELKDACPDFVEQAKQQGLLLNVTAGSTIRLLPPFILTDEQAHTVVDTVTSLVQAL